MNNIVIDIGNSSIVIGIYKKEKLQKKLRLYSDKSGTEQYYLKQIKYLIEINQLKTSEFKCAALSSVVPELTNILVHCIESIFDCPVEIVTSDTDLGLKFPVKDFSHIGTDLIVNAFAARNIYKTNCIICDLGTATTIQLVGSDGYFYGYSIAPGLTTSTECICSKASQLSILDLDEKSDLLGTDTRTALLSGLVKGHIFMLKEFITQIKRKYDNLNKFTTIATGGLSSLIGNDLIEIDIIDENLTLDGLNLICERN
jgi:type III pantothenate kinase